MADSLIIEPAVPADLDRLLELEKTCFKVDRLSRRSMRRFIQGEQCILLVARDGGVAAGYLLILFHRGTRLARLYSLAVDPSFRGRGIARRLMEAGEAGALEFGAIHLRLEVEEHNAAAIALYQALGFKEFGRLPDYYEDHANALRMQKRIRHLDHSAVHADIPWYGQHTPFTCGPAALMMAMNGLRPGVRPDLTEELRLWRETTTIYMTSGHGGCHPFGLALAAHERGFGAEVWVNKRTPLFVEGVRSEDKKKVMSTVHEDFLCRMKLAGIPLHFKAADQRVLRAACDQGDVPIVLISTYRLDRKKAPHWVVVTGYDDRCFYVHDPDYSGPDETPRDLQHIPIAREDFDSMAFYGATRLRSAVILSRKR